MIPSGEHAGSLQNAIRRLPFNKNGTAIRRIELLRITNGLRHNKKRERNFSFIHSIVAMYDLRNYMFSYEINMLLYNVILNTETQCTNIMDEMQHYYVHVFEMNVPLTPEQIRKIQLDVQHIEEHGDFTRISNFYMLCYNLYLFFLNP
jgi:hypothetical protein